MTLSISHTDAPDGLRKHLTTALVISVCVVDSVAIAYDGSLMGSLNVMKAYRNYFELTTSTTAVNTCATFLGVILVGPFTGMLIDWKGRKIGLYAACIVNILGTAIAGAASTYVAETTAPSVRPTALGLYFSCWAVGSVLAAGISYGTSGLEPSNWTWHIPSILQAMPPIAVLCLIPFVPESPRWLAYQDRPEEALKVLARVNGTDEQHPQVQTQYREVIDTLEYEKNEGRNVSIADMLKNRANRKRLLLAFSVAPLAMLTVLTLKPRYYFGSMLTQAGLGDSITQLKVNVCPSSWQLVVAVCGSFIAERLGRRFLALFSLGLCSIFFYLLAGLTSNFGTSHNLAGTYGTIACIFLFLGAYSFGITHGHVCTRVLVTMAFPYMMEAIGWKTYIVNASWNILMWLYIYFQWVETKGLILEEIDVLFDGEMHVRQDQDLEAVKSGDVKVLHVGQ
ncbi:hypothetical protein LCI18_001816 [Fusarium solani-melongenae]|uniref:Uncharacterized protein n=1 Tax=Fusarium solani subsp. cucurbitae TaxID=2747967 RepID=A0ACD3YPK2_FUSSC|nr:hypothetical protein LCI18_001816 [Fusarium solani-melongenae]